MRALLLVSVCLLPVVTSMSALAQEPPIPPTRPVDKSNSQFHLNRDDRGTMLGDAARARARAGDCKGALVSFDAAVLINIDPRLRRDRGLCHEKLGNLYPAMDDLRAYVTARPDAPDAEQIRQRLVRMESETGTTAERGEGDKTSAVSSANYNAIVQDREQSDVDLESPLRAGSGAVFGPYFSLRSFFLGSDSPALGYGLGGSLRYATSRSFTLYIDAGYAGVGESGTSTASGGPAGYFGGELRFAVGRHYADTLTFGPSVGVERYTTSRTRQVATQILGRGRAGYRHTFGGNFAFEFSADVGFGPVAYSNLPAGSTLDTETRLMLGGSTGLVIGF